MMSQMYPRLCHIGKRLSFSPNPSPTNIRLLTLQEISVDFHELYLLPTHGGLLVNGKGSPTFKSLGGELFPDGTNVPQFFQEKRCSRFQVSSILISYSERL